MRRSLAICSRVGVPIGIGVLTIVIHQGFVAGMTTTVTRLSPDETVRARVDEVAPSWSPDRNFTVRLDRLIDGQTSTLLRSPDEGKPAGTERLIWSRDGHWLLLVGRHFYVKEDLFLDNGDQAYFLHEIPTGRSWINSATNETFPPLRAAIIEGIEFTEPIRPRAP